MFASLSRRGRIRVVSFALATLFALAAALFCQARLRARYQQAVENSYAHAFSEVTASLDRMSTALQKGIYVTTAPMRSSLCSEVYSQALTAQMALGQLPLANVELEQTAAFLATVGDYAQALSRSAALGGESETDRENWEALSSIARSLSGQLDQLELELYDGTFSLGDVTQAEERLAAREAAEADDQEAEGFQAIEAEFPELPSLIYDGPFSQHLTGRTPAALEGLDQVSETEALAAAQEITGLQDLTLTGSVAGDLPAWAFSSEDGRVAVEITRQGGQLLSLFTAGTPERTALSPEEGVQAARDFLTRLGMEEMEESYYQRRDNLLTVNFCHAPEGVRCYPDLVKVTVSLAGGEIWGYEGLGYLTNHRQRQLESPTLSREAAEEQVSPLLTVQDVHLAVIPTQGEYEVLCWEFLCETEEGGHVLTYINAATGAEQKLLLLLEDEYGTLAI